MKTKQCAPACRGGQPGDLAIGTVSYLTILLWNALIGWNAIPKAQPSGECRLITLSRPKRFSEEPAA
jgi:hypothetical protein